MIYINGEKTSGTEVTAIEAGRFQKCVEHEQRRKQPYILKAQEITVEKLLEIVSSSCKNFGEMLFSGGFFGVSKPHH